MKTFVTENQAKWLRLAVPLLIILLYIAVLGPAFFNIVYVFRDLSDYSTRTLLQFPRVSLPFKLPSTFTIALGCLYFLLRGTLHDKRWKWVLFALGVIPMVLAGLVARSMFLVPVLLLILFYELKTRVFRFVRPAIFIIFFLLILILMGIPIALRGPGDIAPNLHFRWMNWKIALSMAIDYLPFGAGSFQYWFQYRAYMPPGANETRLAHSVPLQLLAEWGLPGVLLFFAGCYMGYHLFRTRTERPENHAIWPYVGLLILIHQVFDVGIYDANFFPFLLMIAFLRVMERGTLIIRSDLSTKGVSLIICGFLILLVRVYDIHPGPTVHSLLSPECISTDVLSATSIASMREAYTTYETPVEQCGDGILLQPWDPGLYLPCIVLSEHLNDPMTMLFYLTVARKIGPNYRELEKLTEHPSLSNGEWMKQPVDLR